MDTRSRGTIWLLENTGAIAVTSHVGYEVRRLYADMNPTEKKLTDQAVQDAFDAFVAVSNRSGTMNDIARRVHPLIRDRIQKQLERTIRRPWRKRNGLSEYG